MGEKSITSLWECECSSKNPFRFRKCKTCGHDMPVYFTNKIYYEELKEQKAFVFIEDREKSEKRCLRVGNFLERAKNSVIPIMVVLVIALNVGRIYFDSVNINMYTSESIENRCDRLWSELANTKDTINGLRSTPIIIGKIYSVTIDKTTDVSKGFSTKQEESVKNIDYIKIEKVKNKIERGIEYVTSKFE